ncbi:hypothetical protein [Rhodopirellula sp. P2]|uniref:hypothetical protein n=1 Tax=Rhodopirellula sp. P2 TaxID=2127060 RepID=UPI002368DD3B|nr:hypothetical protein [Rhodopirellula sp. P2]WDQ16392.1 hypothetical protein PSR62_22615 [Rhodopirellula sp. P2]
MSRQKAKLPNSLYHVSGQARVDLDGRYFYLGTQDSPESHARYFALCKEYQIKGCRMPEDSAIQAATGMRPSEVLRMRPRSPQPATSAAGATADKASARSDVVGYWNRSAAGAAHSAERNPCVSLHGRWHPSDLHALDRVRLHDGN